MHRFRLGPAVIAVVALLSGCGTDDADGRGDPTRVTSSAAGAPGVPLPMIVDYSPTLSDVPALMFLATHADVELLAVTLPGTGESDCEPGVRNTRALLVIAGHPDVPVACGPEAPMTGDRDWPASFRAASRNLVGVLLPGVPEEEPLDAVGLLADTLGRAERPVTIVTLGPLTNLGRLLETEPGLAANVRSIVTMGGAFDVAGNVEASPDAEWNVYIDPESVRVVLASGAPVTFVPLDATNSVPGNLRILARLTASTTTDAGEAVRQLWAASVGTERSIASDFWYFWDELAAVVAVDPSVATLSERSVAVEDSGATVEREDGTPAMVASAADPGRFEQRFIETFAASDLPVMELADSDQQYLDAVRSAVRELATSLDGAFATAEERADQVPAAELAAMVVTDVFDGMRALDEELVQLDAGDRLRTQHEALLESITSFLDAEDTYLDAFDAVAPSDPLGIDGFFEFFFATVQAADLASAFEAFEAACGDLELAAYELGATEALCPQ